MGNWKYLISDHLSLNGDVETFDSSVDGSVTPQPFYIECPAGMTYLITRLLVAIQDGPTAIAAEGYGSGEALTNGIMISVTNATNTLKNLSEVSIKTNADWAHYAYDTDILDFGNGDDYLRVRWTFEKCGIAIVLSEGERLEALISDDLSGIGGHFFVVQGHKVTAGTEVGIGKP